VSHGDAGEASSGDVPRPIFILGCPRSGTTLLRVMLNAHPRIAIPPETRFLIPAYVHRARFGDLRKVRSRRRLARFVVDRPASRAGRLGLAKDEARALVMAAPPTLGSALGALFAAYAEGFAKQRWGDKRPFYYSFVDELDRMFPQAQFVHVVRDGRACVASLKRAPFDYDSERAMVTWLNAVVSCRQSARRLGSARYHELRYEDLVAEPEQELRRLCEFLGEDYDPAMTAPEEVVDAVVPSGFEQHRQIKAGVNTASVQKWREELAPEEVATFESAAGRQLRAFGYDLSAARRGPPASTARVRLAHRRYLRNLRLWRRREARLHALESPVHALPPGAVLPPAPPRGRPSRSLLARVARRVQRPMRRAGHGRQLSRRNRLLDG
jgi:hypothetical protein